MGVNRRQRFSKISTGLIVSVAASCLGITVVAPGSAVALEVPGDYIVIFKDGVNIDRKVSKETSLGNSVSEVFSAAADGFVAELDSADLTRLRKDRDVLIIEKDQPISIIDGTDNSAGVSAISGDDQTGSPGPTLENLAGTVIPGQYIVTLASGTGAQTFAAAETSAGATVLGVYTAAINGFTAILTDDAVARLRKDSRVTNIEPDTWVVLAGDQTNPPSWGIDRIDQRNLPLNSRYSYSYTGTGVTAYVIDTGILSTHVDFGGRVGSGYSVVSDSYGTTDCNGHGTHVAGTIAGSTYGVAKSASLVPVRVLGCSGSGSTSGVITGIDWVVSDHASGVPAVANLSLGSAVSSSMNAAVASGIADGIVFVVAAGNNNRSACSYSPSSAPDAITVGSINIIDIRSSWSNWGSCVDLFAPGQAITSAWITSSSAARSISGTSMASPHVAGVAALMLQQSPLSTPAEISAQIRTFATPDLVQSPGSGSPNLLLHAGSAWAPPAPVAPSVPQSLVAVGANTQAFLTWVAPTQDGGSSVTDYVVEFSSNNGTSWSVFSDGVSATAAATVTGLVNGTTYLFRVKAVSASGTSEPSATASALVSGVPSEPLSLSGARGNAQVVLTWLVPASAGGAAITDFVIEYSSDGSSWSTFVDGVSTALTATVTGLTNGVSYQFRVSAKNSVGVGKASSIVAIVPWVASAPSAPLALTVGTVGLTSVALSWSLPLANGGADITDYRIEYSSDSGSTWSVFDDGTASMRSTTVTGLTSGTGYVFRVSAINSGGAGVPSETSPVTSPGIPSAPCCVTEASVGAHMVAIRWGAPTSNGGSELTNYFIDYSTDDGSTWTTFDGNTGVVGCVCATMARSVTGLQDGVPHRFRVRAKNAIGTGPPSEQSEPFTPWTSVAPGAPLNVVATPQTGQVFLDWDAPASDGGEPISDYAIEYSINSGSTWTTYADGVSTVTSSTILGLATGVSHIFRVKATNRIGTGVASSASTPITTIAQIANDPFSGAIAISGNDSMVQSSTATATRQTGEPTHGGNNPRASIWYKWVATVTGTLDIDTRLTAFDSMMGIYTGSSVSALTTIAQNDDNPTGGLWSHIVTQVSAGTTYYIAIDGYNGAKGAVQLNWLFAAAPTPELPGAPRTVRGSAGDTMVTAYWLAPTSNGNSTITNYTATATPGGKSCTSSGALTCTVRGLSNGTPYTFAVTATNVVGTGATSDSSEPVTPAAAATPDAPTTVWGLDRIDQRALPLDNRFSRVYTGVGVTAYIIDTGVLSTHSELSGRVGSGYTTISTGGTEDCNGHGTHVAGVIGGTNYGVAPGVLIIPVRVMDCSGSGTTSGVIAGIDWVVAHHQVGVPAVANMSLGGARSSALDLAVQSGVADGVVFVVAAGNSNVNACQSSPAGEPLAITVGATTSGDVRSSFSNYGSCLDVFAPGSNITSAWFTSTTATNTISGTSMASPHVAGVAALAFEKSQGISASQVSAWIASSATSGVITGEGAGSPNLLVYSLLSSRPPALLVESPSTTTSTSTTSTSTTSTSTTSTSTTSTSTTSTSTTSTSTTSTTVPSGGGGGDSGGGDDNDGGGSPDSTTTTSVAAPRRTPAPPPATTIVPTATTTAPTASTFVPTATTVVEVKNIVAKPSARSGSSGTNETSARLISPVLGSPLPIFAVSTAIIATATKVVGNNVVLSVKAPAGATVNVYREGVLVKTVPAAAAASIKISQNATGDNSFQIVVIDKAGKVSTSSKKKVTVAKASK